MIIVTSKLRHYPAGFVFVQDKYLMCTQLVSSSDTVAISLAASKIAVG